MSVWTAPTAQSPIDALIPIPGSKSLTARALFLAAIAQQPTTIRGALESRDTALMRSALEVLGAKIQLITDTSWHITPMTWPKAGGVIDCGLAGTVLRFIPALAALANGTTRFVGDPQATKRPIAPLLDALTQLGAHSTYLEAPGHLPFEITGIGQPQPGAHITVDASASSQFLSALLLAAPLAGGLTISASGAVVSLPHVHMTVRTLEDAGVAVSQPTQNSWQVSGLRPAGGQITIEPDLSNAGPLLAAAMIVGGTTRIPLWPNHTTQVGDQWRDILAEMGATVRLEPSSPDEDRFQTTDTSTTPASDLNADASLDPDEPLTSISPAPIASSIPGMSPEASSSSDISVTPDTDASPKTDPNLSSTPNTHQHTGTATLVLRGPGLPELRGISRDMHDAGELVPTVAALAILASTPSTLTGIGHLRGHETDRLHAIVSEAHKIGARVQELPDGLSFAGLPRPGDTSALSGTTLDSWADHRMATFGALLGLAIPGIRVSDIEATSKTFPTFTTVWHQMLQGTCPPETIPVSQTPDTDTLDPGTSPADNPKAALTHANQITQTNQTTQATPAAATQPTQATQTPQVKQSIGRTPLRGTTTPRKDSGHARV